eukprot:3388490-Alexandrium_andersonii.AAC.1
MEGVVWLCRVLLHAPLGGIWVAAPTIPCRAFHGRATTVSESDPATEVGPVTESDRLGSRIPSIRGEESRM